MANTAKYTTAKAASEDPTAGAASGDADWTVRNRPYTVNGWRPVSVVIHPASTATNPAGPISIANRCTNRDSYRVPRQRAQRLNRPRPNIRKPMPTMMRNDQKVIGTGGQFSRGTVSRPFIGAFEIVLEDQRAHPGNFDGVFDLALRLARQAEQVQRGAVGMALKMPLDAP